MVKWKRQCYMQPSINDLQQNINTSSKGLCYVELLWGQPQLLQT